MLPSFGTARKKAFWKEGASDHLRIVGLGGHIGSLVDELLLLVYKYRIIARFCFGKLTLILNMLGPSVTLDS